jgi:hypothetical protein
VEQASINFSLSEIIMKFNRWRINPTLTPSQIISLHSTAYYLLSYIIILIVFQVVTVASAQIFEIPAIVKYNRIDFLVNTQSWTFDSVKMIFSSGSISSLILGLISLVIFVKAKSFEGLLKLFFFWGFVHGINMFIGSLVLGAFLYEGMGYVFAWMYMKETFKMFLLFAGLIVLIGSGTLLLKSMLLTTNIYYNSSRPETRGKFKRDQFFIPYLVSTVFLVLLRFPLSLYELLLMITPGLVLVPLFSGLHRFTIFYYDDEERKFNLNHKIILISFGILAVFRILWGFGLRIG